RRVALPISFHLSVCTSLSLSFSLSESLPFFSDLPDPLPLAPSCPWLFRCPRSAERRVALPISFLLSVCTSLSLSFSLSESLPFFSDLPDPLPLAPSCPWLFRCP